MNFTPEDLAQIKKKGMTEEQVLLQLSLFDKVRTYIMLIRAATLEDGIRSFTKEQEEKYIRTYEDRSRGFNVLKFVPASGAASRMFKFLFDFLKGYDPKKETINAYINKQKAKDLQLFFVGLEKFPFYTRAIEGLKKRDIEREEVASDTFRSAFVNILLDKDGLDYASKPKGLLPFHKYKNHISTPFEEQLFESVRFMPLDRPISIHFTISPEHEKRFKEKEQEVLQKIERRSGCTFDISYSFQEEASDTIAVDVDNVPLRTAKGELVFRPGGHGSLINNLNAIDADIVFIKNVDNVVVNTFEEIRARHKKILAGLLVALQQKTHRYLTMLENDPQGLDMGLVKDFVVYELQLSISEEFDKYSKAQQLSYLFDLLYRPLRVCGMVKNEGEPGGGPFWVQGQNGRVSLQIVESAQVNMKNSHQKKIWESATHFNPVQFVCGLKDHRGTPYNLKKFVDSNAYFIASKSKSGKKLKALERPGLWNGAMAYWNTVLVEVPLETFNPVKKVNDLLKPAHQKKSRGL